MGKKVIHSLAGHTDDVIGVSYCKSLLATGSDDGSIIIWDSRNWRPQQTIDTREDGVCQDNEVKRIPFSPDGKHLAAACSSGSVLVYDMTKAQQASRVAQLSGHTDCVFDVCWSTCPR